MWDVLEDGVRCDKWRGGKLFTIDFDNRQRGFDGLRGLCCIGIYFLKSLYCSLWIGMEQQYF